MLTGILTELYKNLLFDEVRNLQIADNNNHKLRRSMKNQKIAKSFKNKGIFPILATILR